jgi:hypothetical protein
MKFILSIVFTFCIISSNAQNFEYSTDQNLRIEVQGSNYVAGELKFVTPQPETITFKWRKLKADLPSEWTYSLCGYGTCHVGVPSSGTFLQISETQMNDGKEAYFILNASPKTFDSAYLQIYVYDQNDESRGDTVSITLVNKGVSAIDDLNADISIYPNPTTDRIELSLPTALNIETGSVKNTLGEEVMVLNNPTSNNSINVSSLPKGIYYIHLTSIEGYNIIRKFVKN